MMSFAQKVRNAINSKKRIILSKYNNVFREISTSQKSGELGTVTMEAEAQQVKPKKKIRNWQSYGFDFVDQRKDYFAMHLVTSSTVVVFLWGTIFIISYYPDLRENKWAAREARIQIRRREVLGLPLVDPNYVDPADIKLPPDEDINQEDIII